MYTVHIIHKQNIITVISCTIYQVYLMFSPLSLVYVCYLSFWLPLIIVSPLVRKTGLKSSQLNWEGSFPFWQWYAHVTVTSCWATGRWRLLAVIFSALLCRNVNLDTRPPPRPRIFVFRLTFRRSDMLLNININTKKAHGLWCESSFGLPS